MNDHGVMKFTGKLDVEHYALFKCAVCGRVVGLKPGKVPKTVETGDIRATHQAWILPELAPLWEMDVPEGAEAITATVDAQIVEVEPDDRCPVH